ncbi:hypothetical protein CHS0354_031519 [Potamilus streckersoni]|uniref:Uncharacterized protein n=1 Tax=Potamilus streckersoni TaxID=2493646 RepID=A0AAE0SHA2_9BIVA|nr:hypothetical protein CHS0354_031519 [Potamilus streckersoni]
MSPMLRKVLLIYIAVIHLRFFSCGSIVCRERNEDLSLTTLRKKPLQSKEMLKLLPWNKLLECKQRHTGADSRKMDDFRRLLLLLVTYFKSIYHQDRLITKVMYEKRDARNNGTKSRTLITIRLHHENYTFFMELPLSPFDLDEAGTLVALKAWTQCNPESQIIRSKQIMYSSASGTKVFHSINAHMDIEHIAVSGGIVFQFFKNYVIVIAIVFIYFS